MDAELWMVRGGLVGYEQARALQGELAEARRGGRIADLLVALEHPPVYTKGRRSEPTELPMGEQWYRMQGIEVCDTDRGGRVTYHGPGQLVIYPIVDLAAYADDVHAYVRRLERAMIDALGASGIGAQVFEGLTGVWTAGRPPIAAGETGPQGTPVGAAAELAGDGEPARKIGSIGIHVRRGITTHGLAINVNNDLQPFEWIVPCGIGYCQVTSVCRELGAEQDLGAFATTVAERLAGSFDRRLVELAADALRDVAPGVVALDPARSLP